MDILTLELGDVTVSHALLEVKAALDRHPGLPLRIFTGPDAMVKLNLERLLERMGRSVTIQSEGRGWRLDVAGAPSRSPLPLSPLVPAAAIPSTAPAPSFCSGVR